MSERKVEVEVIPSHKEIQSSVARLVSLLAIATCHKLVSLRMLNLARLLLTSFDVALHSTFNPSDDHGFDVLKDRP
jgi:hypothetical protein